MRHWIEGLGFSCCLLRGEDHVVSDDILPSLTREDFWEMGVTVVGDRRRLLDAIEKLRPAASAPPARRSVPPTRGLPARSRSRGRLPSAEPPLGQGLQQFRGLPPHARQHRTLGNQDVLSNAALLHNPNIFLGPVQACALLALNEDPWQPRSPLHEQRFVLGALLGTNWRRELLGRVLLSWLLLAPGGGHAERTTASRTSRYFTSRAQERLA